MDTGLEIQEWRRSQRTMMLERRKALSRAERAGCEATVTQLLDGQVPELDGASVGFYWPFRGELDLRPFAESLHRRGTRMSLPVVVEKAAPLEFWHWQPGTTLALGVWRIPVPAQRIVEIPTILIVPLLGFDEAGFRLGYGGGYYDRTLAAMQPQPFTVGVGFELGRLPTIHPQPHDIPMNVIATEAGITRFDLRRQTAGEAG
jgi:5-formyltetrahydrofolate cyclo-ligase